MKADLGLTGAPIRHYRDMQLSQPVAGDSRPRSELGMKSTLSPRTATRETNPNLDKLEIILLRVPLRLFELRAQAGSVFGRVHHLCYVRPDPVTVTARKRERFCSWEFVVVATHGGFEMGPWIDRQSVSRSSDGTY